MSNNKGIDEDKDINKLLNVTFDSLTGDLETSEYEIAKRNFLRDQRNEYDRIQTASFKKVKAYHSPKRYTLTQWIRDEKENRRIQAKTETEELVPKQSFEDEIEVVDVAGRDDTLMISNDKTPTKLPYKANPVTAEKEDGSNHGSDDSSLDLNCTACRERMAQCQKTWFSSYCIEAVDCQFRETPLDMTRRKCTQVFNSAYNRAYEFRNFQQTGTLSPKAYYYPPACLKSKLRELIYDIEEEQEDHISVKENLPPYMNWNLLKTYMNHLVV